MQVCWWSQEKKGLLEDIDTGSGRRRVEIGMGPDHTHCKAWFYISMLTKFCYPQAAHLTSPRPIPHLSLLIRTPGSSAVTFSRDVLAAAKSASSTCTRPGQIRPITLSSRSRPSEKGPHGSRARGTIEHPRRDLSSVRIKALRLSVLGARLLQR